MARKKAKPAIVLQPEVEPPKQEGWLRGLNKTLLIVLAAEAVLVALLGVVFYVILPHPKLPTPEVVESVVESIEKKPDNGKIVTEEPARTFTPTEVDALVHQTNKRYDLPVSVGVTKQVYAFTSSDGTTNNVPIYARAYVPLTTGEKPVLAFGPGTTGLGDQCAASLEDPVHHDWANYDSLMMAYAAQGYVVVIVDYEGMRDPARLHHYMNGELEGKTLLDSVRSLKNLGLTKQQINTDYVFAGGYSQGGHAAFWADQIKDSYAPELNLSGSIGFGPVTSVEETMTDVVRGANINWFGPYVLTAYGDWYKHSYPVNAILLPRWVGSYQADSLRLCVDQLTVHWPNNIGQNRADQMYTHEFLEAARKGNLTLNPTYTQLALDMGVNLVGDVKTKRHKLINQGEYDNVVLPSQSKRAHQRMCAKGNSVRLNTYSTSPYAVQGYNPHGYVDHYQTMNASFKDTLAWMEEIQKGKTPVNNCV